MPAINQQVQEFINSLNLGPTRAAESNILFISNKPYEVLYGVGWHAPITTGGYAELKANELIRLISYQKGASSAICKPLHYDRVEKYIVPEETRRQPTYAGYQFAIPIRDLISKFERVHT